MLSSIQSMDLNNGFQVSFPSSFDLRSTPSIYPVQNQYIEGQCLQCVVVAITSSMGENIGLQNNVPAVLLSARYVTECMMRESCDVVKNKIDGDIKSSEYEVSGIPWFQWVSLFSKVKLYYYNLCASGSMVYDIIDFLLDPSNPALLLDSETSIQCRNQGVVNQSCVPEYIQGDENLEYRRGIIKEDSFMLQGIIETLYPNHKRLAYRWYITTNILFQICFYIGIVSFCILLVLLVVYYRRVYKKYRQTGSQSQKPKKKSIVLTNIKYIGLICFVSILLMLPFFITDSIYQKRFLRNIQDLRSKLPLCRSSCTVNPSSPSPLTVVESKKYYIKDYFFVNYDDLPTRIGVMKFILWNGFNTIITCPSVPFSFERPSIYIVGENKVYNPDTAGDELNDPYEKESVKKFAYNHALVIVGWKTIGNVEVWIVRNSYGIYWGNQGYVYWQIGTGSIEKYVTVVNCSVPS